MLHVIPVLLKTGTRMFEQLGPDHLTLEVVDIADTSDATHLRYRVLR